MPSKLDVTSAMNAAQKARTKEKIPAVEPDGKQKPISLRVPETENNRFRALFAKHGLNMSEGCIMAITYVAEMAEDGRLKISKAGIREVRVSD